MADARAFPLALGVRIKRGKEINEVRDFSRARAHTQNVNLIIRSGRTHLINEGIIQNQKMLAGPL